jgi:hypothetical protein
VRGSSKSEDSSLRGVHTGIIEHPFSQIQLSSIALQQAQFPELRTIEALLVIWQASPRNLILFVER